jgi:hypothetical protein
MSQIVQMDEVNAVERAASRTPTILTHSDDDEYEVIEINCEDDDKSTNTDCHSVKENRAHQSEDNPENAADVPTVPVSSRRSSIQAPSIISEISISTCQTAEEVHDDNCTPPASPEPRMDTPDVLNVNMNQSMVTVSTASSHASSSIHSTDPHESFVNVQHDHELLRKSLYGERDILDAVEARNGMTVAKREQQMLALETTIEELQQQLSNVSATREDYETAKTEARNYRRQLDETTAKLLASEDECEYLRSLHNDGYSSVAHTPTQYEAIIEEHKRTIAREQSKNAQLAAELYETQQRCIALSKEVTNLTGLMQVIDDQRREDEQYVSQLRGIYEQRLSVVKNEVLTYKELNDTAQQSSSSSGAFICDTCSLRICDAAMYERHIAVCAQRRQSSDANDSVIFT